MLSLFNYNLQPLLAAVATEVPPTAAPAAPAAPTAPILPSTPAPVQPPQELLAAKTEGRADPPVPVERTILGASSFVEKFSDGGIYVTTDGKKEPITEPLYQMFLRNSTKRVASSTFTGGRSAMEEDTEPIEWGDMDPSFRSLLESTPAVLEAYKTLKNPKKMAKLDVGARTFQPSTNVEQIRFLTRSSHMTSKQSSSTIMTPQFSPRQTCSANTVERKPPIA